MLTAMDIFSRDKGTCLTVKMVIELDMSLIFIIFFIFYRRNIRIKNG